MDRQQIICMVALFIFGNLFTYNSFKHYVKKSNARIENSLMYPLVNSYIGLHVIVLSYMSKWAIKIGELSFGQSQNTKLIQSLLQSSIKYTFNTMIYSTPMFFFIALLTYIFQMHIGFDSKGRYSVGFQAFAFFVNIMLFFLSHRSEINLTEEKIIKYFIVMVTFLSLIKTNIEFKNSSTVDRWASSFTNFFLNFNFKLFVIFSPFVLFGLVGYMVVTETAMEQMTLYLGIGVMVIMAFIIMAIVNAKIEKHRRESESGRKSYKGFMTAIAPVKEAVSIVINPVVMKSILKWGSFILIYSIPLALYIKLTSDDFEIFKQKYLSTFNQRFAFTLACAYATTSILQRYISLEAQKVEQLMSLIIAFSLITSQS